MNERILNPVRLVLRCDVEFDRHGAWSSKVGHAGDVVLAAASTVESAAARFYVWPLAEGSEPRHMAWVSRDAVEAPAF